MEKRLQVFRQIVEAAFERASCELLRSPIGMAHIEVERGGEEIPVVRLPAIDLAALVAVRTGDLAHLPEHIPYLPPECQEAPRADGTVPGAGSGEPPLARIIYSLGAIGYHLLTGKPPAGEGDGEEVLENHRSLAPAPARLLAPDVPAQLSDVLDRMLQKDPRRRSAGREEVLAAIPFSVESAHLPPPTPRTPTAAGGSVPGRTAASARTPAGRASAREAPSRTAPSRRIAAGSGNAPPQEAARPAAPPPARSSLVYLPLWTVVWAVLFFAARYVSRALFHMMDGG
jgi:hypothetical protein